MTHLEHAVSEGAYLLESVLLLELDVLHVDGIDTVDHGLNELHLGVAEPVLVGDVVGDAGLAAGLAPRAAGLQAQLLAALLEGGQALLRPAGQVDVHGRPHAGAEVGGAGVKVPVPGCIIHDYI